MVSEQVSRISILCIVLLVIRVACCDVEEGLGFIDTAKGQLAVVVRCALYCGQHAQQILNLNADWLTKSKLKVSTLQGCCIH